MLTESEKKQPMCLTCAEKLRHEFDTAIDFKNFWYDTCAFCGIKRSVFIPPHEDGVN